MQISNLKIVNAQNVEKHLCTAVGEDCANCITGLKRFMIPRRHASSRKRVESHRLLGLNLDDDTYFLAQEFTGTCRAGWTTFRQRQ